MTTRREWALFLLGAWTMGSICMSVVATENFYTIDRLLKGPANADFVRAVMKLEQTPARDLLRYLSSELNRLYFQMWNVAQIAIGAGVFWLIAGSRKQDPAYVRRAGLLGPAGSIAGMLAIVLLMLAYLTPQIVSLGRSLDFVPRDPAPPGMQRFWILHATYTTLEMLKLLAGMVAAWQLSDRSPEGLRHMKSGAGL